MALVNGLDPLAYLEADETRVRVLNRVVTKAQELSSERRKNDAEMLGAIIARNLAKLFR